MSPSSRSLATVALALALLFTPSLSWSGPAAHGGDAAAEGNPPDDAPRAPSTASRGGGGAMGEPSVNTLAPLPGTYNSAGNLKSANVNSSRKKQLQFEDELVEGMNQNPFDSLEHVSNQELRDNDHLYKKKAHFDVEMKQHVREAGYSE